ncbi:OLC1v1020197C2 [Oldenlandia corymbosa var. corymbosa]|nr:OLC1v1020197C2 [Oldenlandia corymbosa var. corymbosa]
MKKLPPGPWKLPIIGNLHQLMGSLPHHAITKLAQKHGDLMHLQLGEVSAIVASSPRTAKAILKTNDLAFADRLDCLVGEIIVDNSLDIAFAPYGEYWRQMRKICTSELLNNKMVRSLSSIRQDEALNLVSSIREEALLHPKQGINLTKKVSSYTSSMVCRAAFGRAFGRHYQDKLIEIQKEVLVLTSGFDVSDVFPSWKTLHHLSLMKPKLRRLRDRIDEIFDIVIQAHVKNPSGRNGEFGQEDLIDVLLRIKQTGGDLHFPLTNSSIRALILDIFLGGTESSTATVEWAMAELMRNPRIMAKAQCEIRKVLSPEQETIEEKDIQELSYLQLVIKETLRLHPPGPFLIPRNNREQCEIDGYIIPLKTRAIVNAWAIGRDPNYWDDPEIFKPERFENNPINFTGSDYEYLPFGGGRRMCPGISFGLANVEVPLAYLLYNFDWRLPEDVENIGFDMEETYGLTATKKNNLFLVASKYETLGKP